MENYFASIEDPTNYVKPEGFNLERWESEDMHKAISATNLVRPETLKRILDDVFDNPLVLHAFLTNDGILVCMDGGIQGNHLHMAGSGILLKREQYRFANVEPYIIIAEMCAEYGFQIELVDSDTELIPRSVCLQKMVALTNRGVVKSISAHQNCGAARVDILRVLRSKSGYHVPEFVVDEILNRVTPELFDLHAQRFVDQLSLHLGIGSGYIPAHEMDRPPYMHRERMLYIDFVGGTHPDLAFCFQKLNLPDGFTLNPYLISWDDTMYRVQVALHIAFGDTGQGDRLSKDYPFVIVLIDHPHLRVLERNPIIEITLSGLIKRMGLESKVLIHSVSPNIKFVPKMAYPSNLP